MKLSIAMMVKNESQNLDKCLKSLKPLMDSVESELIIVDTGSTDDTVSIAQRYTKNIYFHNWNNNFSEIRNITINYCTGSWIMIIDADEIMEDIGDLVKFLVSDINNNYNSANIIMKNIVDLNNEDEYSIFTTTRLFLNDKEFYFDGAVHNQPIFKGPTYNLRTSFLHYGYVSNDKELMEKKFKRTSTILINELKKNPNNIYYLYQLSVSYLMHKDYYNSIEPMEKAYELIKDNDNLKKDYVFIYSNMAKVYFNVGRYKDVEDICEEGIKIKKDYLDLYYFLAVVQYNCGKYEEALKNINKFLNILSKINKNIYLHTMNFGYDTVGKADEAYNLMIDIYFNLKDYKKAISNIYKIKRDKVLVNSFSIFIKSCISSSRYLELVKFYTNKICSNESLSRVYFEMLIMEVNKVEDDIKKKVFINFIEKGLFGDLSNVNLKILDKDFMMDEEINEKVKRVDFNDLSYIYGDLIYYFIMCKKDISSILDKVREDKLDMFFDYIFQTKLNINYDMYQYLKISFIKENLNIRIKKIIDKKLLSYSKEKDINYKSIVMDYIQNGIKYIEKVYKKEILENEHVELIKNSEDAFLLYIYKAYKIKNSNKKLYIKYLRKSLKQYKEMKDVVEFLMNDIKKELDNNYISDEFKEYQRQFKNNIKSLMENNKLDEAEELLNQYKNIVKNDCESYSIEAVISIIKNDMKKAEKVIIEGLKIDNKNFDLLYNLAYIYKQNNELELAIEYYKLSLENCNEYSLKNEINNIVVELTKMLNLNIENEIIKNEITIKENLNIYNYSNTIEYIQKLIENKKYGKALNVCDYYIEKGNCDYNGYIYYFKAICCNALRQYNDSLKYHKIAIKINNKLFNMVEDKFYNLNNIKIEEKHTECIGCGFKEYEIVDVTNQSCSESNKGLINPLRTWVKCNKCGLIYANPIPSENSMNEYYSKIAKEKFGGIYGDIKEREEFLFNMANYRLGIIEKYSSKSAILDIGTGIGVFVKAALNRGWIAEGIELTPEDCKYAKEKYNLDLLQKNFYDFSESEVYDVVTMFEVIEHLRTPLKDLKKINSIVKKDGIFVLATPIQDSKFGKENGCDNLFWNVVSHVSYFNKQVMIDYLNKCGFEILEVCESLEGMGRMEFYCRKVREIK